MLLRKNVIELFFSCFSVKTVASSENAVQVDILNRLFKTTAHETKNFLSEIAIAFNASCKFL